MNRLLIATGVAAALFIAVSSNAQVAEAPIPTPPPSAPTMPQPAPSIASPAPSPAQPPPRIEMPSPPAAPQQAAPQTPEPMPPRSRSRRHARRRTPASHVDQSAADYFTRQLNQRELESLEPGGGGMPRADAPGPPWRDLYPPQ